MKNQTQITKDLFELANHYPSPHNGQPIVLEQTDDNTFVLNFERERGLQATEISLLFSYVTMGVFVEHLKLCAKALGHDITIRLELPPLATIAGEGPVRFATCQIMFAVKPPDEAVHEMLLFRQTSRKKYFTGIDNQLSEQTIAAANQAGMQLVKMDRSGTHQAIWLNQRAVFDDMFEPTVRQELDHWLRYSDAEKKYKRDGLAYDCMELNGSMMKFIVRHYKLLRLPGVSSLLKKYYLRTMSDESDAFYLLTPFSNEQEGFNVGVAVMEIWQLIAANGYYLHPFGTIMSNQAAHDDFLKLVGIDHEDRHQNFLVFIYRAGKSEPPHHSLRLPLEKHLLRNRNV